MALVDEKNEFRKLQHAAVAVLLGLAWGCDSDDSRAEPVAQTPQTTGDAEPEDDDDAQDDDEPEDESTTGEPEPEPEPEPDDGSTGEAEGTTGGDEPEIVYTGPGCGFTPTCDKGEYVGSIRIASSDQIEEIAGYTSISGWLEIDESDLECLDFLICMQSVGRNLSIFGNTALKDTRGLDNLTALGTSTTELGPAEWDGSLVISNNAGLEEINGFNGLLETQESLNINRNDNLLRVRGFGSFETVQRNLVVRDNPQLESIEGLAGLQRVGGSFLVTQNPNLCLSEINILGDSLLEFPGEGGSTEANNTGC